MAKETARHAQFVNAHEKEVAELKEQRNSAYVGRAGVYIVPRSFLAVLPLCAVWRWR